MSTRCLVAVLSLRLFWCLSLVAVVMLPSRAAVEIHVSPHGSDTSEGTERASFATLERAKAAVRTVRQSRPAEPVAVSIAAGTYHLEKPLTFGAEDSGTANAVVTWSAREPGTVTLSTGRRIDPAHFRTVTDGSMIGRFDASARGHILQLDLRAAGIKHTGPFPQHFTNNTVLFRLFSAGALMPNSRWPNGKQGYVTMERVLDSGALRGDQPHGGTFRYRGNRPERWLSALESGGVWLRGFWRVPWVVEGMHVRAIDSAAHTISFAVSTPLGIGSKYTPLVNGTRAGNGDENWYAVNLIEEIDEPGEWAVDFVTNTLYFWPPRAGAERDVVIADDRGAVASFQNASHITLRHLQLRHSLGSGVEIEGGDSIVLAACRIHDQGEQGVLIRGGLRHRVAGCEIFDVGLSGVDLLGGDRQTLVSSQHEVLNNHIHHIGLAAPVAAVVAGYGPRAVLVGARIAHNRIHDGPSAAVRYAGNENLIEYNEVYRIGLDSSDLGAFYTNSGFTTQGNVLRHNFVHHCENAQAFYLDDGDSGDTVEGNIVYKAQSGAFVGGGHLNTFRHNLFVGCDRAIHVDARGSERGYTTTDARLGGDLASVPYRTPPWSERYPDLVRLASRDTTLPSRVVFENNVDIGCKVGERRSAAPEKLAGVRFGRLETASLDIFRDPDTLDFRFRDPAIAARLGVPVIPFEFIGLQIDEMRTTIPERDLAQLRRESTARKKFDSQIDVNASDRMGRPLPTAQQFISQEEQDYARAGPTPGGVGWMVAPARELNVRGGLPQFFAKARAGQPLTVAYFGGSITAHDGWRPQSFAKLQAMFPQSPMTMVNASVGGTGSIVGVFRADRDLVSHRPDLVFVEFAVNDGGDAVNRTKDVLRALEAIVRKVRKANPAAGICLVYTMQTAHVDTLRAGNCQPAAAVHERVAAHYELPSIHVGPAVVQAIDSGLAVFHGAVADKGSGRDGAGRLVLTEDNTHPVLPTGHAFYADVVARALRGLAEAKTTPALLPPPLGESWETAKTLPVHGNAQFRGQWDTLTAEDGPACARFGKRHYTWFPYLYRTAQSGSSVTVRFKGTMIGLRGMEGPDSGIVEITVDGMSPVKKNHFTVYSSRWTYGGTTLPELAPGEHSVTWTFSADKPDKAGILASHHRKGNDREIRENPAKFEATMFSVGEITLVGEILP